MDGSRPRVMALQRHDAVEKITGAARYTFDVELPGMAHGKILRSPHAHARIVRIDASRAESMPGVLAVVTGRDIAALPERTYGVFMRDQPVICTDKVRYIGDSVAAVAAVDEETAYAALAAIDVHYEVLQPVASIDAALAAGAPLLFEEPQPYVPLHVGAGSTATPEPRPNVMFEYTYTAGDIEQAFARCDHVFEDSFEVGRLHHFYLEPYVTVARVGGERIEVWTCNQDPFVIRNDIARIFGKPEHLISVHSSYIGGGFGGKSFCKTEPLNVLLAMKAGRPVRLCFSLDECLLTLTKHPARIRLKTGVMRDGKLVARQTRAEVNGGAYADAGCMVAVKIGYRINGPYRWDAVDSACAAVRTNVVPAGSFRGFGGTQASYASESQIDLIARRLRIDPIELRKRNLLEVGQPFLPGDSGIDSDLARGLDTVVHALGYYTRQREPGRGMGFAIGIKDGGGTGYHAQAVVKVTPTGRAIVMAGVTEIGQGASSVMPQIAARILDIPDDWAMLAPVTTDHTPLNAGTHVSVATTMLGKAVENAARNVREDILKFAAAELAADQRALELRDGAIWKGNESFPLEMLVRRHFGGAGYEFVARGYYRQPYDEGAPLRAKAPFWLPSWVGAEVAVDEETGAIAVLQLVVCADSGHTINLAGGRGQTEGGAMQALGMTLFEDLVYDGVMPVNARPMSYRTVLARDMPQHFEAIVEEHGLGPGPFGAKGIGEGGMLGIGAAIANAVHDATGARVTTLPLTPERVLAAIDVARKASASGGL